MPTRTIAQIIEGRTLITVSGDTNVRAACCLMAEKNIGALLVVEGGRIAGIFTERDALKKVLAAKLDPDASAVAQVMVADPQTIRGDKPLGHALYMMAEGGYRHVPVVNESGAPIGMVSSRDALGQDMIDLERDLRLKEQLEESIGY